MAKEAVDIGGSTVVVDAPPPNAPPPNAPTTQGPEVTVGKKACFTWGGQMWGTDYPGWDAFKAYLKQHGTDPDKWIDAHAAAASCIGASKSTVAYNPYGYVEGGSSSKVGAAVEAQAITTPGANPVQVPTSIEDAIPPTTLVTLPDGSVVPFSQVTGSGGSTGKGGGGSPGSVPPDVVYQYTHDNLEALWQANGGPGGETADIAAAIAQAESNGCRYALAGPADIRPKPLCTWTRTDGENSCGFWQINLREHKSYSAPSIFDPDTNAQAAVAISKQGTNFDPWTTYRNGAYKKYLTGAGSSTSGSGQTSGSPSTPAGVKQAWRSLVGFYATTVPTQHANVTAVGNKIKGVFG